jgi:pSer/pThr/pTyr-binding forkhead associated (FHA) protein/exo-beta-1,3-glucanase (GH17 family)
MKEIFISYVEEDKVIAAQLATGLENDGFRVWYYGRDSIPGQGYISQVAEAIDNCKVFILIASLNSIKSLQVTNELVRAYEGNKSCIPLLFKLTHDKLQELRPDWRQCLGAIVSAQIPDEGIKIIIPRLVNSLNTLGIYPSVRCLNGNNQEIRKLNKIISKSNLSSTITLTLYEEGEDHKRVVFDAQRNNQIILGRDIDCDLIVGSNTASRKHTMLHFDKERGWLVTDLSSTIGTLLNGERLTANNAVPIKEGDRLTVGTGSDILVSIRDVIMNVEIEAIPIKFWRGLNLNIPKLFRIKNKLVITISTFFAILGITLLMFWFFQRQNSSPPDSKEWKSFFGALPWLHWVIYDPTDYDPFLNKMPSLASIRMDLEVMRRWGFSGLITMTTKGSCKDIAQIAHEVGFNKVIVGVWNLLDSNEISNAMSIAEYADAYCLGNGRLNKLWNENELLNAFRDIRYKTNRPVTTTEAIAEYHLNPRLAGLCDFLFPDVHANWFAGQSPQEAWKLTLDYARQSADLAKQTTSGRALLKMVSYPSGGDTLFTPEKQLEFFKLVVDNLRSNVMVPSNVTFSYLCAFDPTWKTEDQGFIEPERYTGLFTFDRKPKLVLSGINWQRQ